MRSSHLSCSSFMGPVQENPASWPPQRRDPRLLPTLTPSQAFSQVKQSVKGLQEEPSSEARGCAFYSLLSATSYCGSQKEEVWTGNLQRLNFSSLVAALLGEPVTGP